jgi:hypothetical protein
MAAGDGLAKPPSFETPREGARLLRMRSESLETTGFMESVV